MQKNGLSLFPLRNMSNFTLKTSKLTQIKIETKLKLNLCMYCKFKLPNV